MGIKYEDFCCNCATEGYPCTGEHKKVPIHYCDECGEDEKQIYLFDGEELCGKCVLGRLDKVEC